MRITFGCESASDIIEQHLQPLHTFWGDLQHLLPARYGVMGPVRELAGRYGFGFVTDNNQCSCTVFADKAGECALTINTDGTFSAHVSVDVARDFLPRRDLRGADLRGQEFFNADLRFALLSGADLRGADLQGACMDFADLTGADLRGAYIKFTSWDGACFDHVKMDAPFSAVHSRSQMWYAPPEGQHIELYEQRTGIYVGEA